MTIDHPDSDTPVPFTPADPTGDYRSTEPDSPFGSQALNLGGVTIYGDRAALFKAMAEAQGGYAPIKRTRTVTVRPREGAPYSFDYAPLEEVLSATVPSLNQKGMALVNFLADTPNEDGKTLHTLLTHESGACIHTTAFLPPVNSPQALGSQVTYARRYSVQCVLGVSPEVDDDGNEASGNKVEAVQSKRREPAPAPAPRQEKPPAPRSEPIKPQATQRIEEPHPHAPPPEPTNGAPCSKETGIKIRTVLKAIGVTNGVQANELCKQVTGGTSDTITESQGQAFLTFLENEATKKGVVLP